jgi:hypothetical protein
MPRSPKSIRDWVRNTFGLAFDTNGNLYVNEDGGQPLEFTRNSFSNSAARSSGSATPFTNPNPAMSDQIHTIFIPQSANLCDTNGHCAAFIQAIFVSGQKATLDPRLLLGSFGRFKLFRRRTGPCGYDLRAHPERKPQRRKPQLCQRGTKMLQCES